MKLFRDPRYVEHVIIKSTVQGKLLFEIVGSFTAYYHAKEYLDYVEKRHNKLVSEKYSIVNEHEMDILIENNR